MSIRSLAKCIAAFLVLGILGFTCLITWHVTVQPVDDWFDSVIPASSDLGPVPDPVLDPLVEKAELVPEVDPGEPLYVKATEHLAMGHLKEAREKLNDLVTRFPRSPKSSAARKILGEMNLDDWLSNLSPLGKVPYHVKPGDSYLAIAARERTTLENLMHMNGMLEMQGLRPGDELVVMPLNFRFIIDTKDKTLSVWNEAMFVCEFPMISMPSSTQRVTGKNEVSSKSAEIDGKRVMPGTEGYVHAVKVVTLKAPSIRIQSEAVDLEPPPGAITLKLEDMETLNLLVRSGNSVEFR